MIRKLGRALRLCTCSVLTAVAALVALCIVSVPVSTSYTEYAGSLEYHLRTHPRGGSDWLIKLHVPVMGCIEPFVCQREPGVARLGIEFLGHNQLSNKSRGWSHCGWRRACLSRGPNVTSLRIHSPSVALGLGSDVFTDPGYRPYATVYEVRFPSWLFVILLATYPAIVFVRGPVRRLVTSARHRKRLAAGLCQGCGYDLSGNESGTCPECGTEVVTT